MSTDAEYHGLRAITQIHRFYSPWLLDVFERECADLAYMHARWAARAAFRDHPELRESR